MKSLRSFFAITLSIMFLSTTASANSQSSLKDIFDQFNYKTTVEWDQKDEAFLNDAVDEMTKELNELKSQGLGHDEINDFIISNTTNPTEKKKLESFLKDPNQSGSNVFTALEFLNNNYQQGASFNPTDRIVDSPALRVVGIIVIGATAYILVAGVMKLFPFSYSK